MYLSRKYLSRRTVIRGAGASIALPLLDAMIPAATALAQTAAASRPKLGFVYFPHGAVMQNWTPQKTGRDFDIPSILKPLEAFREHMTIVSGLRNKAGESNTPHAIIAGTWLGCTTPAVSHNPKAGTTIDQIAAQKIGQDTPFPSLELSTESGGPCDPGYGCSYGYTISFRTPTQPLPMEYNPRKVFYQLFGKGDNAQERVAIVSETQSILDSIVAETASLNKELGKRDQVVVAEYLDSLRETERRIEKLQERNVSALALPDAPVGVPNDFEEHIKLMFDMMALAYQANLTRVASFMMAKEVSMRTYTNLGISEAFHPLSHHGNNPEKMARLSLVQNYHSKLFAGFLKRLAATDDGDGSLLDHIILLYGSNMSNSNLHNNDPLPAALFGRGYGALKGGQHLHYAQDTPLANLMLTILERAGIGQDALGNSTGALTEI